MATVTDHGVEAGGESSKAKSRFLRLYIYPTTTHPVIGPPVHGFPPPLAAGWNSERKRRPVACPDVQTFPLSPVPAQNLLTKDRLVAGPRIRIPPPSLAPALHVGDKGRKHWMSVCYTQSGCYTAASLIQVVAVPLRCSICWSLLGHTWNALKSILASTVNRTLSRSTCLVHVVVLLWYPVYPPSLLRTGNCQGCNERHTWSVVKSILASIVAQTFSLTSSICIQCSICDSC
ncbi:hypothetical protein EV363DRAFT_1386750 [Boletus edulis]|nr:hypothetical protein EV363DRAFT_1386750 [Boletus edulis]